jgi:bifunctional non-homologous end joining protein LigD
MSAGAAYDPQKALLVDAPPSGERWVHEIKLDGFRMGVRIDGSSIRIISRRGNDYTAEYPEIVDAARQIDAGDALLDGEVVVLDERGVSSFERLQGLRRSRKGLAYFAFDLLSLNGERIARLPLIERKARLEALLAPLRSKRIRYAAHFENDGARVFAGACELGAEGIVSKRRDAPYRSGARSSDWQKVKCVKRQEFVVGGFTDPEGSRVGIGSLLVGYNENKALRFAGKVGTGRGWTGEFSRQLRRRLEAIEQRESPFTPRPPGWLGRNAHWVAPRLVAEVSFSEWTAGGHVRHPTLLGFRNDKRPRDVVRERPVDAAAAATADDSPIVFPRLGLTRAALADLYRDIADAALPHVVDRPLTLVRALGPITRPDALRSQARFVHHTARDQAFVSARVPRMRIKEKKKIGEYCYIDSADALVALIESGVVEWHVWNARVDDVERPDRIVFDLDPGAGVAWTRGGDAARSVRARLERYDLASWVKTTGGKGLHVVVPFERRHDWDAVFAFSKALAAELAAEDDERYTLSFDRAARHGKVLIDYKRNYRTSIAVAPLSLRASPRAPLSVPVSWSELGRIGSADRWTAATIRARLRRQRRDPWAELLTARQRLPSSAGR